MSQIGVFTPEQARALWQDYLSRQQLRPQVSQNYPLRRQPDEVSPHRVFIRNDSGETLPAYGCAQVTGTTTVGGVTVVTVDKPSSTSAEYLFCSQFDIADGDTGWAYRYGVVVMLGDAPASAGAQYGPIVDSWEIEEKSGPFVVFGAGADAGTLVGRVGSQPQETTEPGSGGPCSCGTIYARGSVLTGSYGEHATTYTITAPCDANWPFPEVTHDTGENWVSPEEDLCTCYGSSVPGELTLTPCGSTTVCGVTRYHAKITLASTAGETRCDYETAEQPAAVWYIDDWHPLGPTSEAVLVSSTVVPNSLACWEPPGKLCVGPKTFTFSMGGGCLVNGQQVEVTLLSDAPLLELDFNATNFQVSNCQAPFPGLSADLSSTLNSYLAGMPAASAWSGALSSSAGLSSSGPLTCVGCAFGWSILSGGIGVSISCELATGGVRITVTLSGSVYGQYAPPACSGNWNYSLVASGTDSVIVYDEIHSTPNIVLAGKSFTASIAPTGPYMTYSSSVSVTI